MSYSVITISGNITRDPETVTLKNGNTGVRVGVAVNKSKDTTVFYDTLFTDEGLIERITKYAKKGSAIALIGDHNKVKIDDKTYENIYGTAILELYTRVAVAEDGGDKPAPTKGTIDSSKTLTSKTAAEPTAFDPDDDDLPF